MAFFEFQRSGLSKNEKRPQKQSQKVQVTYYWQRAWKHSWLIIDFKLWSTVKMREQTHRVLKNTFLPTKMRKKRTFMRLMHRLFGIKICCNAHTTISQFHNHTQELKVKYPGMSITGCNKISQSLVFVLTQLYCGHQSSFPLCQVWFYSGLSEVFTFSCGKSILCDQLTHVRHESVDCQPTLHC